MGTGCCDLAAETVGEIVRLLRGRRKLEQIELANACGWRDASAVSRIETDRIKPTRRTLEKLAQNLADPSVEGDVDTVRARLYMAAGLLPTRSEIDALTERLPMIDSWPLPTMLIDFGWFVWGSNSAFARRHSFPTQHVGRNYLSLLFEPGGRCREGLGVGWNAAARAAVIAFRKHNDARAAQRWHRRLLADLSPIEDFVSVWDPPDDSTSEPTEQVMQVRLPVEPRLAVACLIPADADESRTALVQAALAG